MVQTRVVVYLKQNTAEEEAKNAATNRNAQNFGGEVSVLDEKTLRLLCCQNDSEPHILVAQKLNFDEICVADNTNKEEHEGLELNAVMHNLFVERRNGMVFHLTGGQRGYHLMFLVDALVVQVNVKLQQECLQLEQCTVKYRHVVEGSSTNALDTECTFSDMRLLMNWLMNEYRMRRGLATEHEALQVEYMVFHKQLGHRFKVKFHILFVAMEELCLGTLCGLRCYLSHDLITAALSVTELTSYIRKAEEEEEEQAGKSLFMLMLCNVQISGCQIDCRNVQLLGLAQLACQERYEGTEEPQLIANAFPADRVAQVRHFENVYQEINQCFKLIHSCLLQYVEQEQQVKEAREILDKQRAKFVPILLASEEKLMKIMNLMINRTQN